METLETALCEVAGHLNAQHARLVQIAVELLADERPWAGPGVWRADQFLAWKCGLSPHRARQIITIAERAGELPVCVAAFGRGELSVDQMVAIAQRAPWWTDAEICRLGAVMTVRQLRNVLARYPFPEIPRPEEAAGSGGEGDPAGAGGDAASHGSDGARGDHATAPIDAEIESLGPAAAPIHAAEGRADPSAAGLHVADRCWFFFDDDGRFHLSLDTDKATGDLIEAALTEARDRLFGDGQHDVTWTDALRAVAQHALDAVEAPERRDRYRINYHIDTAGGAVDHLGARLPDAVARHLGCDGLWTPIFTEAGLPASVGRTQRIVPDRTRRLVELRDQGCRVPGCTQTRWLDVHHIIHWLDHGPTDTWNLICLCPHHHRLHHHGTLGIAGNADDPNGVVFTNTAGNPIAQSGARPTPPGAPPAPPIGTYRHPLGERLDTRWLHFNPPRESEDRSRPRRATAAA